MKKIGQVLSICYLTMLSNNVFATAYTLPSTNQSLIGEIKQSAINPGETSNVLTQRYDIGHNALESANPQYPKGIPAGAPVQIPTQHLLPNQAREGIVVNLPEMRMYYYPKGSGEVFTYPIGIGKIGKTIPIKRAVITYKKTDPTWIPPEDIREFNLEKGIVLPKIMPPGPDNPLGPYAIYMSIPTYLIHSTPFPESVGTRASFGCLRMYETDVKELFPSVSKGIPIVIVNSPVKVGWQDNNLYMEAHEALEEHNEAYDTSLPGMVHQITETTKDQPVLIDWQQVAYIAKARDGIPHQVGVAIP